MPPCFSFPLSSTPPHSCRGMLSCSLCRGPIPTVIPVVAPLATSQPFLGIQPADERPTLFPCVEVNEWTLPLKTVTATSSRSPSAQRCGNTEAHLIRGMGTGGLVFCLELPPLNYGQTGTYQGTCQPLCPTASVAQRRRWCQTAEGNRWNEAALASGLRSSEADFPS